MRSDTKKTLRICQQGHEYYKSSECPTCPVCEQNSKPHTGFLSKISAPARRALQSAGIHEIYQLAEYSENEIFQLHGIGPSSFQLLKKMMEEQNILFKTNTK